MVHNGGADINFGHAVNKFLKFQLGASAVANIADAAGMLDTKAPFKDFGDSDEDGDDEDAFDDVDEPANSFVGFGRSSDTKKLIRRVGGLDARAKLTLWGLSLLAEKTTASGRFNANDLSYNGLGAKPSARHVGSRLQV